MPYQYTSPDIFLTHNGVAVFHMYDVGDSCRIQYWFTTDPTTSDDFYGHGNRGQFDARRSVRRWPDTPTVAQWDDWWKPRFRTEDEAVAALIKTEIDEGRLSSSKQR